MTTFHERLFARHASTVGRARTWVLNYLADRSVSDRVDDVRLCVSELVTNAIEHGTPVGRDILVRVTVVGDVLRVEVHDAGNGVPRLCTVTEDDDHGRGLLLLDELADDWGVSHRQGPGKAVWAEFTFTAPVPAVPAR